MGKIISKGVTIAASTVTRDTLPIGSQVPFGSLTIPDNWLLCDGREVSRIDYSELFNVIGTSYGSGNGLTTFNIPNKKGRISVGYDISQTEFDTIGETGGAKTHTLTEAEMPIHNHSMKFANNGREVVTTNRGSISPRNDVIWDDGNIIKNTGGGQAHNNLQPYETDVWIIKARQSSGVVATVVDNLTSTSTTDALSAGKGKELNDRMSGTVLYNNSDGSNGNITLSETCDNFSYLKIKYKASNGVVNVSEVTLPIGSNIYPNLTCINGGQVNETYISTKLITVLGTSISNTLYHTKTTITPTGITLTNDNDIYITKVVGYN